VINPEPQESAAFRAEFFDAGWVCHRSAQHRAEGAAAIFGVPIAAGVTWGAIRRRSFVD
jgi:hypothetical protein